MLQTVIFKHVEDAEKDYKEALLFLSFSSSSHVHPPTAVKGTHTSTHTHANITYKHTQQRLPACLTYRNMYSLLVLCVGAALFALSSASPHHLELASLRPNKTSPLQPRGSAWLEADAKWSTSSGGQFGDLHMSLKKNPGNRGGNQEACIATGSEILNQTSCVCSITNDPFANHVLCVAALLVDPARVPDNKPHPDGFVVRWKGHFLFSSKHSKMKVLQPQAEEECLGERRVCDGLKFAKK